ncbi:MAG: 50S ribosomal protein P1 [Nanoarchaeota archaeon]|nr:50S ribosomal protein P1 [Nanoarchaeota archaeon]MBU1030216.1 50S ribosomal protein P1 [Nanoarchaeota archaeon]MBU1850598.1 50S ribosomal protein P1 [Nanoarchaeota archaeon]
MEYIYCAMLLYKAGQKIDESSMKKVLEAAGVKADAARIKALVAALDGVDIEEAIKSAAVAPAAAPAAPSGNVAPAEVKEEQPKEEEKSEEQAAAGLGALFG